MRSTSNTVAVVKSPVALVFNVVNLHLRSVAFALNKHFLLRFIAFPFRTYPVCVFLSVPKNLYAGGDEKQEINLVWSKYACSTVPC